MARESLPTPPASSPSPATPRKRVPRAIAQYEPKAILFDFDGVIVNSEPIHFQAMQATLASEKIEITEEQYYAELIGFDDRGAFRHVFASRGRELDPKTMLRVMTTKSRRIMDVIQKGHYAALPGVSELVRGLWRHYPLAICSGALREEIEAMLEGIGLRDCFPTIVAAEDVTVGKPDPQGYLMTAELVSKRIGPKVTLKASECLVVEDAPSVIRNVKAAGFRTLGVAGSYRIPDLQDADQAVRTLSVETMSKAFGKVKLGV